MREGRGELGVGVPVWERRSGVREGLTEKVTFWRRPKGGTQAQEEQVQDPKARAQALFRPAGNEGVWAAGGPSPEGPCGLLQFGLREGLH